MRSFNFKLVNGRFGDPALYLQCVWEKRALLFDLGDIRHLRPAEILRVSDVFITHTHIDHFIGFDHLLRIMLNRDKTVRFFGPEGLIANVAGKLAGYTWNLVDDYRLRLQVYELAGDRLRRVTFTCENRFRRRSRSVTGVFEGLVVDDARFSVRAALLDHAVPSVGYALHEKVRLNINRDRLGRLGWKIGPWLGRVKEAVRAGDDGGRILQVPLQDGGAAQRLRIPLREIVDEILIVTAGTRLAYVSDINFTAANQKKVRLLAQEADLFFCEAAFAEKDADHARRKDHLTAGQAGRLARLAGAKRLEIFHFSPKYLDCEEELLREAAAAHRGGEAAG